MSIKISVAGDPVAYNYPAGPLPPYFFVIPKTDGRIVFHLGVTGKLPESQDINQPYNLGAYTVTIDDGDPIEVPSHWWNARWTYRPHPIAVVKTPEDIVAARRMFPFGKTGCVVPKQPPAVKTTRMGSSDIVIRMPTTGERPDIGLCTDNSGYAMLGGDPDNAIQWGLAGNTCPMHIRDQMTNKPVNLLDYPGTNTYSEPNKQGWPWVSRGPRDSGGWPTFGGGWEPQQAHYCEMSYTTWQLTRDGSFLEDLQYSANFTVLCDGYLSGGRNIATVYGELRGLAWAFRNLFMAHAATLDAEAEGLMTDECMPSSYWKQLIDNQLAYYTKFMTDPENQYYRVVGGGYRFGPWQVDYMLAALAFGVLTGHADWVPMYVWAFKNAIDRGNVTSGYPPGWGCAYYLNAFEWVQNPDGSYNQSAYDLGKPLDWYHSFLFQKNDPTGFLLTDDTIAILAADPLHGGVAINGQEYLMSTRAAFVMADFLEKDELVDMRHAYPDFDVAFGNINAMVQNAGTMNPRQSYVTDFVPPDPKPPEPPMGKPFTVEVGASVFLPLTWDPSEAAEPNVTYTAEPEGIVTLAPGDKGVEVTGVAAGSVVVTASDDAGHSDSSSGVVTVPVPLVTAIHLNA